MEKENAATERFNQVSNEWDLKPSTVAVTSVVSKCIKESDWYKTSKGLRAMDFGCGTGYLTQNIINPNVFREIVGVDLAPGMIAAFQEKLDSGVVDTARTKVSALCVDLGEMDAISLKNMAKSSEKSGERFDVIYSLLTLHHVPNPADLLNKVLKERFLNPKGGRIVLVDYERDPEKQSFHPEHLKEGVHFEHDGFKEEQMRSWFTLENKGDIRWNVEELQVTKMQVLKPVDPADTARKDEVHNLLMVNCVVR